MYLQYRVDTAQIAGEPWLLLVGVSWLPYMTLSEVVVAYVGLSLPLAPAAARTALNVVGTGGGLLLMMPMAYVVMFLRTPEIIVALACLVAVSLAALLAAWIWLDRTYRTPNHLLPR
ncbi:hypothetical protein BS78_08G138600 [Paspalum vaginatum]|nr:hypothetical protein BS78_08G138600 [Paspalum vaginatum]